MAGGSSPRIREVGIVIGERRSVSLTFTSILSQTFNQSRRQPNKIRAHNLLLFPSLQLESPTTCRQPHNRKSFCEEAIRCISQIFKVKEGSHRSGSCFLLRASASSRHLFNLSHPLLTFFSLRCARPVFTHISLTSYTSRMSTALPHPNETQRPLARTTTSCPRLPQNPLLRRRPRR